MALTVYSKSRSFEHHLNTVIEVEVTYRNKLSPVVGGQGQVYLVHGASFSKELSPWLEASCQKGVIIGVAADNPQVSELLVLTQVGVKAYFNAYMSNPHYAQMLRLLSNGQSWYPPALLGEAFDLARSAIRLTPDVNQLEALTKREREVALAVAKGKSNKLIATDCAISERTVKSHLTHIFKKLQVKDRVALVIHLNQFEV